MFGIFAGSVIYALLVVTMVVRRNLELIPFREMNIYEVFFYEYYGGVGFSGFLLLPVWVISIVVFTISSAVAHERDKRWKYRILLIISNFFVSIPLSILFLAFVVLLYVIFFHLLFLPIIFHLRPT